MNTLPSEIKTNDDFQIMVNFLHTIDSKAAKCAVYNLSIASSLNVGRWNIANNMLASVKSGQIKSIINTAVKHGYAV